MSYSQAVIDTLKRDLERQKNLFAKNEGKQKDLAKSIETLEKDIKENDPSPSLALAPVDGEKEQSDLRHSGKKKAA